MATKSRTMKNPDPSLENSEKENSGSKKMSEMDIIKKKIEVIGRKVFGTSWDEFE